MTTMTPATTALPDSGKPGALARWGAIDGIFAGANGAGLIAVYFLLFDVLTTETFRTPSLVGQALLRGISPASAPPVDLGIVALFSLLHGAMFVGFGWAVYTLMSRFAPRLSLPVLAVGCAVALHSGIALATGFFAPGLLTEVGYYAVLVGNLIAGTGVAASLVLARNGWDGVIHRP